MTKYSQITVAPNDLSNALNALKNDGKDIAYIIPCHEYNGTLIIVVFKEFAQ